MANLGNADIAKYIAQINFKTNIMHKKSLKLLKYKICQNKQKSFKL